MSKALAAIAVLGWAYSYLWMEEYKGRYESVLSVVSSNQVQCNADLAALRQKADGAELALALQQLDSSKQPEPVYKPEPAMYFPKSYRVQQ